MYLKVLSPSNRKDFNMFTLHDIQPDEITTLDELKEEVFMQCGEDAQLPRTLEFRVGYFSCSQKLWINNKYDLEDTWNIVRKNERLTFWALGTSEGKGKKQTRSLSDDELENVPLGDKKEKKVSIAEERKIRQRELRGSLQVKHGSKFNAMQYTFWAESILAQTHDSIDEPPNSPLFGLGKSRRSNSTQLTEAFSGLANSISDVMRHNTTTTTASSTDSPSKVVALCSKYLEQRRELHSLFDIGAMTAPEYEEQRGVVVELMRQLSRK